MFVQNRESRQALEAIALGECAVGSATKAISVLLEMREVAADAVVYDALRSWTWKALEARRRDDQLELWAELMGSVVSFMETQSNPLAAKVETLVELLQPSITLAVLEQEADPMRLKHVKEIMCYVFVEGGSIHKKPLMAKFNLAEANVSRILGQLIDCGWFQRIAIGREAVYRLTEAGRAKVALAHTEFVNRSLPPAAPPQIEKYVSAFSNDSFRRYGNLASDFSDTGPSNYLEAQENAPLIPTPTSSDLIGTWKANLAVRDLASRSKPNMISPSLRYRGKSHGQLNWRNVKKTA